MLNTISQIENNQIIRIKQNSKKASYHYKSEIKHFTTFKLDSNINNIKLSRKDLMNSLKLHSSPSHSS